MQKELVTKDKQLENKEKEIEKLKNEIKTHLETIKILSTQSDKKTGS